MVFYSSFAKAIKRLPESEQLKAFWSIVNYGIFDEQPEEDGLHMVVFDMAKDQIDANVKRRESGSYGDFNPRSREGSDAGKSCCYGNRSISIHAPAKGATPPKHFCPIYIKFQSTLPRRERPYLE